MAISDADVKRAEARMQGRLKAGPKAVSARYDRRVARVVVSLDTGLELAFPPHLADHWSVWVNGNWRMTFTFEGQDATLVDYQDYH